MMKQCKYCGQHMLLRVDDEGGIGGVDWNHYVCKVCLSELDTAVHGNKETITWTKNNSFIARDDKEAREWYRKSTRGV